MLGRNSNRWLAVTSMLLLVACDSPSDGDGDVDSVAPRRLGAVYSEDGSFTLSTASVAPEETVRREGPLTLEYVGAHKFVVPESGEDWSDVVEVEEGDVERADRHGFAMDTARLVDELGREWRVIDADVSMVDALAEAYRQAHQPDSRHDSNTTAFGDYDDSGESSNYRSNWVVWDCSPVSTKWEYTPGSMTDLESLNSTNASQRRPILDFVQFSGTAVLIAPNLALTAGHAANGTAAGDTLCARTGSSGTQCRTVSSTFVEGNGAGADDWGLIRFSSSFTDGYEYVLSDSSDSYINNFTPRVAGYPTLRMDEEASCGTSSQLEGERNLGTFHSLTTQSARLNITTGGGTSGAPYYYYDGGEYRIFGVHSYRSSTLGDRYSAGPKVPFWFDDIVTAATALGVSL